MNRGRVTRVVLFALLTACGQPGDTVTVTVRLPPQAPVVALSAEPGGVARSFRQWPEGEISVGLRKDARVVLRWPEVCPVTVTGVDLPGPVVAKPWIAIEGDVAQLGFDAPFEIRVAAGCAEATGGHIDWRQTAGAALTELRATEGGFRLTGRTLPLSATHPEPLPWGIAPFSPRTQGRYDLEATWIGAGGPVRRTVTITAVARATGVPSVAVGQRVVLGGDGWRVQGPARGGVAQVERHGDLVTFAADVPGAWHLVDDAGRSLQIRAGRHDRTPLDCGRADCHRAEAEANASSPMTHALERLLTQPGGACALECHAAGQVGLHDGGFLDVASSLGWTWTGRTEWREVPRALRRLGGVTCTACHGPAAIPDPASRDRTLSADVCATCHDAPPVYVHVEQWRESRMARSDATPETRSTPGCVRCHTTGGFLTSIGVRRPDREPHPMEPSGIACAACHAPHGAHVGEALERAVPVAAKMGGPPVAARQPESALCLACHAPGDDETLPTLPSATAGAIWLGRAPAAPDVTAPSAHAGIARGCLGCHTDHTFRARAESCSAAGCHTSPPAERSDERSSVRARALALWARLGRGSVATRPAHASTARPTADRATYEVALVLEDPAAAIHNAPFARALLDDAEKTMRNLEPRPRSAK